MSHLSATCENCGSTFAAERKTARFCSVRCRVAQHRLPRRKLRVTLSDIPKLAKQLERQRRATSKAKRDEANAAKAAAIASLPMKKGYEVRQLGVSDLCDVYAPDSFDWIITDPPYPREFLPLFSDLGRAAACLLKPGGLLVCLSGQSHLPEVIQRLGEHLQYHWQGSLYTPSCVAVHHRKVLAQQKPVLLYSKGKYAGPVSFDIFRSGRPPQRERHVWEQSLPAMLSVCRPFVQPYDLVLDPFMGSGTTGVAVLAFGGLFVGCDIDAACVNDAAVRLAEARQDMTARPEYWRLMRSGDAKAA